VKSSSSSSTSTLFVGVVVVVVLVFEEGEVMTHLLRLDGQQSMNCCSCQFDLAAVVVVVVVVVVVKEGISTRKELGALVALK